MKTRLLIIIGITGVIILGSGSYAYSQMYDCLNPPLWMKISFGFERCFQLFINGNLPDWTQAKEDYETKQTLRAKLIEQFKDKPEVVAFYSKYDDTNVSVLDDHLTYFAGREDGFFVRMDIYFDKNYELDHIDFHCYFQQEHQYELPQEDIASKISRFDCKEYGSTANTEQEPTPEPAPNNISNKRTIVEGEMAEQICEIMGGKCPSYYIGNIQDDGSIMVGITISKNSEEMFHLFFIKDGILSHEVRQNEN